MTIKIELISESELADESFSIVIDGLNPRETYRVEMFLSDYYCINAPMLQLMMVMEIQQRLLYQIRMVCHDMSQTPSCSDLMKVFQQWTIFNAKPLTNKKKKLPTSF